MSYANIFYNRRKNIIEENKMTVSPIRVKSMQQLAHVVFFMHRRMNIAQRKKKNKIKGKEKKE